MKEIDRTRVQAVNTLTDGRYANLHQKINRLKKKTGICAMCGEQNEKTDFANLSGLYLTDVRDWIEACRKCNSWFDKNVELTEGRIRVGERNEPVLLRRRLRAIETQQKADRLRLIKENTDHWTKQYHVIYNGQKMTRREVAELLGIKQQALSMMKKAKGDNNIHGIIFLDEKEPVKSKN